MDINEEIIVLIKFDGNYEWYIADKEIWVLNHKKRIQAYKDKGYEVKVEWIDPLRRDLLEVDDNNFNEFYGRLNHYKVSTSFLKELFNGADFNKRDYYLPSLLINYDEKFLMSNYQECYSFEDYAPSNWDAVYGNFEDKIPKELTYWK